MTWGQALTGLIVVAVVGAGILYVIRWLQSGAPRTTPSYDTKRGPSSPRDPTNDDIWRESSF